MTFSSAELQALTQYAIEAAVSAGQYIAGTRPVSIEKKNQTASLAAQVVTEVDRESQAQILRFLEPSFARYDLGLLTEESPDDGSRLEKEYFWCIDPIDGTLSFIDGVPGYAVSIALVSRAGIPLIGVVYDPVEKVLYHAVRDEGAFRNSIPWRPSPSEVDETLRIFTDPSELEKPGFESIAQLMGARLGSCGGAVMNAIWCLEHPHACYFKLKKATAGGGCSWDFAATACLYREVGAWASDVQGEPLNLNRTDSVFMNRCGVLFASSASLAQRFLKSRALSGEV